jgi:PknH-like extracellular domain
VKRVIALSLAFVIVLAGPVAAKGNPKPPKNVVLTNDQIAQALLALSDMPTGWAAEPSQASDTQASATNGYCNGPNQKARADTAGDAGSGFSSFAQDPKNGPAISETVFAFPTVDQAKAMLAATQAAISGCTTWQTASDAGLGITITWTASALSFPKITDQILAARQQGTNMFQGQSGASVVIDNVYLRKGNHVVNVDRLGTSADPAQLQQYAQAGLNKLGVELAAAKKASGHKK